MNVLKTIRALICSLAIMAMAACTSEEKFETAQGDVLVFSVDTLRMDTVIAGTSSVTRGFTIYNHNSDGVSIVAVGFKDGKSNGFRANVDGTNVGGTLTTSIDCRKDDSLLVFVEMTPEVTDTDDKVLHEATLQFTLANGTTQGVVLQAYSQNVIWLRDVHITQDTTLVAQRPYVIAGGLTVDEGATLTLAAGVRLLFQSNASMLVEGTLISDGTLLHPVVLRGDRMDMMFENQPYDRVSNQWGGVRLSSTSYGNRLTYTDIHSGSYGIRCDSSDVYREKLRLVNSVIHNVGGHCLEAVSSKLWVGNSQITNAGGHCVSLIGGDAQFVHCTIGQFYPFDGMRGAALAFTNEQSGRAYPLLGAFFYNCIVTGYSEDEVAGEQSETFADANFNYGFYNCLLNTPEIKDDPQVVGNVWDVTANKLHREGNFPGFNLDWLVFDFHLDSLSLARGAADIGITQQYYLQDRDGVDRLSDGTADAGCYEYR
ncbi:MAG: hypothetical protein PUH21_03350 [Prevotellaceae bacterium]|nr:hypothetical protein [Prevotellaceae bacterium]MDY3857134.1 hypothetical protein [Bacteroidaceae bacterium]